jgi:hypothetical protein
MTTTPEVPAPQVGDEAGGDPKARVRAAMAAIEKLSVAERHAVLSACHPWWVIFVEAQRIKRAQRMTGIEDSLPPLPVKDHGRKRKRR